DRTVAKDLTFDIGEKRFTARAGSKPIDVVRAEVMQKSLPVAAAQAHARPITQLDESRAGPQGPIVIVVRCEFVIRHAIIRHSLPLPSSRTRTTACCESLTTTKLSCR